MNEFDVTEVTNTDTTIQCPKCFSKFKKETLKKRLTADNNVTKGRTVKMKKQKSVDCPACGRKALYREIEGEEVETIFNPAKTGLGSFQK